MVVILFVALTLGLCTWLALTWWHGPEEKTFKSVVQDMLRDVREIAAPLVNSAYCASRRLWGFFGPRLTNLPTLAIVALDCYAALSPEMREIIAGDHRAAAVLLALNLFARLSPRNAPQALPAPASPSGGMVNNAALA